MKSTLYIKFIILYLVFGFLSFFTVGTLGTQLQLNQLKKDIAQNLYQEANMIATEFLPSYFEGTTSLPAVSSQMKAMNIYLDASVWLLGESGTLIDSVNAENTSAPRQVEHFNPAEIGSRQYMISTYHGYFSEDVITVIAPVIEEFSTHGYLMIHKPVSTVEKMCSRLMRPVYFTVAFIYLLAFIILLGFHFFIYLPLRKITDAATRYASGDLDYKISVHSSDEIGYLSSSLNYMSARIRDMDDYQKKIVANVSHDFRSPLTSIKGYVEAIADGTIPPEMHEKYLNIILFETERLTDLTKDLLTLNEFDTNQVILEKTRFDIQEMIKLTAASFEGVCRGKHISIRLLLLPDSMFVKADSRKIQQVLYNLIDNAIKFSDNDSTVTIEVTQRGEKVMVSVKDSGAGIPPKDLNKIWERFYKADSSRGKDKKGTGLGLSIVRDAIQAHGEHINVISTVGVGTEFIFSLTKAS